MSVQWGDDEDTPIWQEWPDEHDGNFFRGLAFAFVLTVVAAVAVALIYLVVTR